MPTLIIIVIIIYNKYITVVRRLRAAGTRVNPGSFLVHVLRTNVHTNNVLIVDVRSR